MSSSIPHPAQHEPNEPTNREAFAAQDLTVLENLMAAGLMLPAQLPSPSAWSSEKRLAAAVLASAIIEIRDHHASQSYRKRVRQDLEWLHSDNAEWPFSFVRLCAVFDLDPAWVREVVARWTSGRSSTRSGTPYRHAA